MTTIKKDDYIFEVDIEKTTEYYKTHSLCECDDCKNYYAQIKGMFPKLDAFLSEFGIDVSKPDEILSVETDNSVEYINVDYTVCGKIINTKQYEIDIHDNLFLNLVISDGFVSPNEQTGDYFTISVCNIKLPWVLDTPFPEPVNITTTESKKSFFKRIFNPKFFRQ